MKTMEDCAVTNNLCDVATEIQRSSFAVLKVSPNTATKLTQAWREAINVFNQAPNPEWTKIVDGHLHGYHVPSPAKRLFRAFPSSTEQPWPNENFRQASNSVAEDLHRILADTLTKLEEMYDASKKLEHVDEETSVDRRQNGKRPRLDPVQAARQTNQTLRIDTCRCPLDYFLYHNQEPNAVNCSEHIDRGLLIAVSLTDVPGLEILVKSVGRGKETCWTCPEINVYNSRLYEEAADSPISDLICIMSGGQLAGAIGANLPPCVHRVRQKLKRSRLSISYELRAR